MTVELRLQRAAAAGVHLALGRRGRRDPTLGPAPAADGTRLDLAHEGFADEGTRDDHVQGWTDCLDRLPAWLASDRG